MDDDENGLFNISLSDDEEKVEKVPRDFQSEEDFQKQRAEWTPTIETGQVSFLFFPFILHPWGSASDT